MPVMGLEEEKSQPFKTDRERSASLTSAKKFEILSVENPTLDTPSVEPSCEERTSDNVPDVSTPNDILLEGLLWSLLKFLIESSIPLIMHDFKWMHSTDISEKRIAMLNNQL